MTTEGTVRINFDASQELNKLVESLAEASDMSKKQVLTSAVYRLLCDLDLRQAGHTPTYRNAEGKEIDIAFAPWDQPELLNLDPLRPYFKRKTIG